MHGNILRRKFRSRDCRDGVRTCLWSIPEVMMIKDVMVWLDGGISDEVRLAAVAADAPRTETGGAAGLFLNPLPLPGAGAADVAGSVAAPELLERAREAGHRTERLLAQRLSLLERPVEIRRFDVLAGGIADLDAREARA